MSVELALMRTILRQCGLVLAGISLGMISPAVDFKTNRRFIDMLTKNAMGFFLIFDISVILIAITALNDAPFEILAVARLMTYGFEAIVRFICFEMMIKRIMMQQKLNAENLLVYFYRGFVALNCLVQIALTVWSFIWVMTENIESAQTPLTDTGLRIVRVIYYSFIVLIGTYYDIALIHQLINHINSTSDIRKSVASAEASKIVKLYFYIAADAFLAILVFAAVAASFSVGYLGFDTYVVCFESTFSFHVLIQLKQFISDIFNQKSRFSLDRANLSEENVN